MIRPDPIPAFVHATWFAVLGIFAVVFASCSQAVPLPAKYTSPLCSAARVSGPALTGAAQAIRGLIATEARVACASKCKDDECCEREIDIAIARHEREYQAAHDAAVAQRALADALDKLQACPAEAGK